MDFFRCQSGDAERVYVRLHEVAQGRVDHAMALDPWPSVEGGGDDAHSEVTAPVACAGVARMGGAVVAHVQLQGREAFPEAALDLGAAVHDHGSVRRKGLT